MRLDGVLVNSSWRFQFSEAFVPHLPRVLSDHSPLLISLDSIHVSVGSKNPFRFYTMWLTHLDYREVACSKLHDFSGNLITQTSGVAKGIHEWAAANFGNVFKMKKKLLTRIRGIQHALDSDPNYFLTELQFQLQKKLNLVLLREENLWRLKSRQNWIRDGDRNTIFFNLSTLIRTRGGNYGDIKRGNSISCN